ncbi:MAG TPA: DNA-processing protein DprA, partial [Nitrospirota bacterium]
MKTSTDPVLFWIGLSSIPGVGRITFRKLVNHFGSPERALAASQNELQDIGGLSDKAISGIASFPWRERAELEVANANNAGISIVIADDPAYPAALRNTPDPPLFLYIRGSLLPEDGNAVAIVGTRTPTHYGTTITGRIAADLASAGFTIVSGMARGIDTLAHKGALAAKGRTIAVLGCGIDVVYPPENKGLMEEIARNGAVISENPFGTKPEAGYFPARNRIISGLSRGTAIIEAATDSGSLITANYALEQGRKLYAVPGNIGSPNSRGTNSLIKRGATLVESAEDVLKDLGVKRPGEQQAAVSRPLPALTGEEETVFRCITNEPKHIDIIMNESRTTAGRLSG